MAIKNVAYHKCTILSVTRDRLEYLDEQGIPWTIDFYTCQKNVQKELRGPGWMQVQESQNVYVGCRDFYTKPRYITLASDPPTCFQFAYRDHFREFKRRLIEAGVNTIDMA